MRIELRRLQKEVGVTTIYVTHDQSEALALSDRIAVMRDGRIAQIGTPYQIYQQPGSAFVATFVGRSNLLRGRLLKQEGGGTHMETALGAVLCQASHGSGGAAPGAVLIRPEHVVLATASETGGSAVNRFRGRVLQAAFLGEATECIVRVGETEIVSRNMAGRHDESGVVDVIFPPEKTLAIEADET
jgi:iron(III) transport system ATP-binding protein